MADILPINEICKLVLDSLNQLKGQIYKNTNEAAKMSLNNVLRHAI